jgi:hypothetical protein
MNDENGEEPSPPDDGEYSPDEEQQEDKDDQEITAGAHDGGQG